MNTPLIYLALDPTLASFLELDSEIRRLDGLAQIEQWNGEGRITPEALADVLSRATVVVTGWGTPPLTALGEWSPESSPVRLIAHSAGTIKQLLPRSALERGLQITHANDALAESVAEFTLGAIIMGRRQAFAARDRMRAGQPKVAPKTQRDIMNCTVGVIGASAIGRRLLHMIAPLGARVLLYDPYCSEEQATTMSAHLVDLQELLRHSDVVTLHAPVTSETIGMLGAAEFAAMQDGGLFINTARGRLIDANALLNELQSGRIFALLDVTDPTEPLPPDSPFFALENCVVLPHMAAVTVDARRRQSAYTVDEIERFLKGEPLRHIISAARWDTMA